MAPNEYFADGSVLKFVRPVNGTKVEQRVADGFINATAMCMAHGKDLSKWLKTDDTLELVAALADFLGISPKTPKRGNSQYTRVSAIYPSLVVVKRGSSDFGGGTWIHPKLATALAQWCSKPFAIQVAIWVEEWLLSGRNPFKVDLDQEFMAWQQRYDFRIHLKDFVRPELMAAVVQYAELNGKNPRTLCSQVHDLMNQRIQGYKSKELKALNGLPLGELLRDYFEASPLVTYSAINTLARNGIIDRELHPLEAVNQACDQFLGKTYDPKPLPLAENLYAQGRRLKQARRLRAISQGTQLKLPFEDSGQAI